MRYDILDLSVVFKIIIKLDQIICVLLFNIKDTTFICGKSIIYFTTSDVVHPENKFQNTLKI